MQDSLTTRELADFLGIEAWRIRRLFELGCLDEPPRFAGRRAIPRAWIPEVVDALRSRGWLSDSMHGPQPLPERRFRSPEIKSRSREP